MKEKLPAPNDPWQALRRHTAARIGLGRVGASMPTAELLRFGLAHAKARDAVHSALDATALAESLQAQGFETLQVKSMAPDREHYLLRPDLGRSLHPDSRTLLEQAPRADIAMVVADGLSAQAASRHALPVALLLRDALGGWPAPVIIAQQARVALGDDIGAAVGARLAIVMLGERPGLSSPDSLGIYLTWAPRVGRMDSERNCISNVRPEGLSYEAAAHKLHYLVRQSLLRQLSGVALKDDSGGLAELVGPGGIGNA
ncbi:MAG: ethanolamine ammonia-lyase [Burkholderia sp.]|nr:ethanolamine ammonia-lyase [Burkholderia sp.]